LDENLQAVKMILGKKLKVSWLFLILIGVFFNAIQGFSQCGIKNLPTKLVYIGKDNVDDNLGTKNPDPISIPLPISFESEAAKSNIKWTIGYELLNHLDATSLAQNKLVLSLGALNSIEEHILKGSCGATSADQVEISIKLLPAVHPRNAITGNADDINAFWDIINLEKYTRTLPIVKVFDRWGKIVFESSDGYVNKKFIGINSSGSMYLPTGTYIYSIIPEPDYPELIGELTLIR